MSTTPQDPSPWTSVFLGAGICLLIPALFTTIAPVSYLHLARTGGSVTATSRTCLLFCIPYITQTADDVTSVDERSLKGQVLDRHEQPESGLEDRKSEDQGFLILRGQKNSIEVQLTPCDIPSHQAAIQAFLKDDQSRELRLFCVSNWKAAVFAGGPLCCLTILYLIGLVSLVWSRVRRFVSPSAAKETVPV